MNAGKVENLYKIQCPNPDKLCCLKVHVPSNRYPLPQWHIIVCREFIFTEKDILATPLLSRDQTFVIVMEQSLYKTARIQQRLKTKMLQFDKPTLVTMADLQACLQYTIMARMSGRWNQVGEFLVEGEDFLLSHQRKDAMKLSLTLGQLDSFLTVTSHVITLPPTTLLDFGVNAQIIGKFSENRPNGIIEEHSIILKWCHVLPSMKKGQVINVTHRIPVNCPFKSYREIKTYWRATYGYYLPESEESVYYCQVYFKFIGDILFTYPSCCVRTQEPVVFRRQNLASEMKFITELASRMPTVCSCPLTISHPPNHTAVSLSTVALLQKNTAGVNLVQNREILQFPSKCSTSTKLSTNGKDSHPIANIEPAVTLSAKDGGYMGKSSTPLEQTTCGPNKQENLQKCPEMTQGNFAQRKVIQVNHSDVSVQNGNDVSLERMPSSVTLEQSKEVKQKIVPIFTSRFRHIGSKSSAGTLKQNSLEQAGKNKENVEPRREFSEGKMSTSDGNAANNWISDAKSKSSRSVPSFQAGTLNQFNRSAALKKSQILTKSIMSDSATVIVPRKFQTTMSPVTEINRVVSPEYADRLTASSKLDVSKPCKTSAAKIVNKNTQFSLAGLQKKAIDQTWSATSSQLSSNDGQTVTAETKSHSGVSTKRKIDGYTCAENVKKPRTKPKIQEGVDIESLIKHNQAKLNKETLVNWLKQNGVSCKAKDKKEELVEKALKIISVKGTES